MCAMPTAPAWLQRAGLGADVMGTGGQQRESEGGGRSCCLRSDSLLHTLEAGRFPWDVGGIRPSRRSTTTKVQYLAAVLCDRMSPRRWPAGGHRR